MLLGKKKSTIDVVFINRTLVGTPEKIRTPDLLVRSQTLYPAELPALVVADAGTRFDMVAHLSKKSKYKFLRRRGSFFG